MISVYSLEQENEWCEIIRSFLNYDVYYLPQYSKGFALHGDGAPQLIYYEDKGMRAANVVMCRDIAADKRFAARIPKNRYFDLVTPYGYGGWLFEGSVSKANIMNLDESYQLYCQNVGIISEFVRFHPLMSAATICSSMYEVVAHGQSVCLDISNPEVIWNNICSLKRNRIRKAMKRDVSVHYGLDKELMRQFQNLYNVTMQKNGAAQYYFFAADYYNSLLTDLNENTMIFYAMKDNRVIASMIIIMAGKNMSYHLGGSDPTYRQCEPNSLLIYSIALWGNEHGYKTLLLGGGLSSREDSLYRFKKGFNERSQFVFHSGRKIFNKESYQQLCDIRNELGNLDSDSAFFPRYRV